MFRQENSNSTQPMQSTGKKHHRKLYAILAGLLVIVIVVSAVLVSQGNLATQKIENPTDYGSSLPLNLNYVVGEQMVYETTNILTNQMITDGQTLSLTKTMRIISENDDEYKVEEKVTVVPNLIGNTPTITVNISKASYYNNFIPRCTVNLLSASSNPTIAAYLAQKRVNVGDVWKIPVNTGNSSLGMTGEITLKFTAIEDITVPAGTYKTMKIEITSNTLSLHADGTSGIIIPEGQTLQLNGTTYLEQGTCRLIKADLTQVITTNSPTAGNTTTEDSERILVKHTRP